MDINLLRIGRRLVASLLLLVAVAHACLPMAPPFERVAGSAFSASTSDVSTAQDRVVSILKRVLPAQPLEPVAVYFRVRSLWPLPLAYHLSALKQAGHAPPASQSDFRPLSPRAPPAA